MSKKEDQNSVDAQVDIDILECLRLEKPTSFFLFAGAGSGKTASLVNVLKEFKKGYGKQLRLQRKKVAIITYTNAACDEIIHRLEYDPVFAVSTIHSFAWELIRGFTSDIKLWVEQSLKNDITILEDEQSRSRNLTNKTSVKRAKSIDSKRKRLNNLENVIQFKYNPNSDNTTKDSLNHSEVISLAAHFIQSKSLMRDIIVSQFPILLIDESQDTKRELIEAFFELQIAKKGEFTLGLFGDTMQRIYADGKENLERNLPEDWVKPAKKMNHRSNKRIIALINAIREQVDRQEQTPRVEKVDGFVRLFLCKNTIDKDVVETNINKKMAQITNDPLWDTSTAEGDVMTLILEHHMAAKRLGFINFFEPLYSESKYATGVLDGTLAGANFFTKIILPLYEAYKKEDKFAIANIIKNHSPFLKSDELKKSGEQIKNIEKARVAAEKLFLLWESGNNPKLIDILKNLSETGLFEIPTMLSIHTATIPSETKIFTPEDDNVDEDTDEDTSDSTIKAWGNSLESQFSELIAYNNYISDKSKFGTHQGVKGLEFPRVAVILEDEDTRGFLFNYGKLFGEKELTKTDKENMAIGKETGFDRTRRLFYVACSRAKESLAIIAYTDSPTTVRESAKQYGWFTDDEIIDF